MADQGLVAILNLALSVSVAQVSGLSTLGRFAVVSTTTTLCMGVARLLVTDPWLASRSASREAGPELRWLMVLAALGAAVVTAFVVLVACGGDDRWLLAIPIAALVVVQDFGRYLCFRMEHADGAFASDLGVLVGAAIAFLAIWGLGSVGVTGILTSWAVGLAAGTAVVSHRLRGPWSVRASLTWWASHCRYLASRLALDTAAYMLGVSGSLYLLAYLGSQRDVGLVRIVQTMFSPAALVVTGLTMWLVPFLANRTPDHAAVVRARASLWLCAAGLPLILLAVALGPWFARLVFGVHEAPGLAALTLAGLSTAAMAIAAPWIAAARVSGRYLPIALSRTAAAIITVAGMLVVPALRATTGYLAMLAMQNTIVAASAVSTVRRGERSSLRHPADPATLSQRT